MAEARQPLAGWVNNAAVFDDMELTDPAAVLGAVEAKVVAFLLSGRASFVSGAVVAVDGGRAARGLDPEET